MYSTLLSFNPVQANPFAQTPLHSGICHGRVPVNKYIRSRVWQIFTPDSLARGRDICQSQAHGWRREREFPSFALPVPHVPRTVLRTYNLI
jgi:hypothetical protein